ncbi:MAG: histidine kinase, partial [Oscillospiraceae bacterium]|nr:histidine kinase [Oscillospiraceae bacterium]
MNTLQITNASVIIFCILINITILFFVLINKVRSDKRSRVFIGVLSVNFILLMSFLIRQYYEGQPNPVYNSLLIYTASIYQATSQVLLLLHIKLTLLSIERKTAISGITKYAAYIAAAAVCINLILSVATPFTHVYFYFDEMNKTVLQDALIISDITTFIWAVLTLFILISNKKNLTIKEIGALMSYVVLPTIALIFYLITLNLHFIIFAIMLSIIIYYASIQSELSQQIKQQELDLKQKELELSYKDLELVKNRIATMTSQIQPHFIYNTLSAIKSLIRVDPKIAIETVS